MSDRFVTWLRARPRRGLWLGLWANLLSGAAIASLGQVPYTSFSVVVVTALGIFAWRRLES